MDQNEDRLSVREAWDAGKAVARVAAVTSARDEIARRRQRLREIGTEEGEIREETIPASVKMGELQQEGYLLKQEIEAYSRVVDSAGKKPYVEPSRAKAGTTTCAA